LLDEGLLVQNVTCRFSGAFTRPGSTSWLGTHALSLWAESNDAGAVVGTSDSSQTDQLAKTGESNHYEWITGRFCLCRGTCWKQVELASGFLEQSREWCDWNGSTAKKIYFAPKIQNQDP
jgi:hypothetical protein